jgi:hypothetical protein
VIVGEDPHDRIVKGMESIKDFPKVEWNARTRLLDRREVCSNEIMTDGDVVWNRFDT